MITDKKTFFISILVLIILLVGLPPFWKTFFIVLCVLVLMAFSVRLEMPKAISLSLKPGKNPKVLPKKQHVMQDVVTQLVETSQELMSHLPDMPKPVMQATQPKPEHVDTEAKKKVVKKAKLPAKPKPKVKTKKETRAASLEESV